MLLNMVHTQTTAAATALTDNATGLRQGITNMKDSLAPMKTTWFVSGSEVGDKVRRHEEAIDVAMAEITRQLAGSGEALATFTASIQRTENALA
jgi:hypothetical protein